MHSATPFQQNPASTWQPILQGVWQQTALETACAIADQLRDNAAPTLPNELSPAIHQAAATASLSSGAAGQAILFAYLAQVDNRSANRDQALFFLEQAMDCVATTPMRPALHGGFTGVGWSVAHLMDRLLDTNEGDPLEAMDEVLCTYVRQTPWTGDYDLIGGLVGLGLYALERLPNATAITLLTEIVNRLTELAEETPQGITWFTPPALLPEWQRTQCPNGYYNLGLAHGIPGAIGLLGRAVAANVAAPQARQLLKGAAPWLLAQEVTDATGPNFASWIAPHLPHQPARTAWCYGEPGLATALLIAARAIGEPAWETAALTIARRAATRSGQQTGVRDAGLCHGAAGLAQIFNRLYQATGDEILHEAACNWLRCTLALRVPGQGIGGYLAWEPSDGQASPWVADPGLLTGAAGVALVLLAAATPIAPEWDRMLLLSDIQQQRAQRAPEKTTNE